MGWLFSIAMFVVGCLKSDSAILLISGLFAIAGSIRFATVDICRGLEKLSGKETEDCK